MVGPLGQVGWIFLRLIYILTESVLLAFMFVYRTHHGTRVMDGCDLYVLLRIKPGSSIRQVFLNTEPSPAP